MPWEETEDYIRSGHRDSGDFKEGSLKTIVISAEQGIKAIVGRPKGKTTTEVQSYLFSRAKDWTIAKAKAWFKEHRERRISIVAPVKEKLLSEPRKVSGILALPGWSRNMNLWLPEEIEQLQAAFTGAPIYYEHIDSRNVVGETDFVAFDPELGLLAYQGSVFDEDAADKIEKGLISFVSLGVNYTRLDQVDGQIPRGPYHDGEISLVAVPGVQGTSVQIAEKTQDKGGKKMGGNESDSATPQAPTPRDTIEKSLNESEFAAILKDKGMKFNVVEIGDREFRIEVTKEQQEPPKAGEPKTDRQRLIDHFGEEKALKLLDLIGDEAYKLLPPRGTKVDTSQPEKIKEVVWTRAYINDLSDTAFAVILPGGEKDEGGRTTPRSLRKFPHHTADGKVDVPHLRNANARAPQSDLNDAQKSAAKKHLDAHKEELGIGAAGEEEQIGTPSVEDELEWIGDRIDSIWDELRRNRDDINRHEETIKEINDKLFQLAKESKEGEGEQGEKGGKKGEESTTEPKESGKEAGGKAQEKATGEPKPPEGQPAGEGKPKAPPAAEGVVDPDAKPTVPEEYVPKKDILAILPDENMFRRAPFQLAELVRRIRQICE